MFIEGTDRFPIGIRDDNLGQVFPQRFKNGTRLRVGPFIQDLELTSRVVYEQFDGDRFQAASIC